MFESAEIGHKISKEAFRAQVPPLRTALLEAQVDIFEKKIPVILLISGQDGAGKSETINVLYEWMDPRYLSTLAFSAPSDEDRRAPIMARYWRALPPRGRIGIFAGSWYSTPLAQRLRGEISVTELDAMAERINRFEAMLVNEGAVVLKFWFHLTADAQRKRLKDLEANSRTAWRVTRDQWERLKTLDQLQATGGHFMRMTNTAWAPWLVVDGSDDRYRSLTVGKAILTALQHKIASPAAPGTPVAPMIPINTDGRNVLSELDLEQSVSDKEYERSLAHWQGRLYELMHDARLRNRSLVIAFEGADAAGKGGAIRRIGEALDARQYQVIPVAAPSEEERAQPYLWRFWRHLPLHGQTTIFDRTWYGRVLVERVEGFCAERDWLRAYTEINDFEHEIAEAGGIVVKFWLQISQEEQLRRFKEREQIAFKRFKITQEDWRNREKWDAYQQAVCDMVERTSTGDAPWTLVEANDKKFARLKILRTLCERLELEFNGGLGLKAERFKPARSGKGGKSKPGKSGRKNKKAKKPNRDGKAPDGI